MITPATTSAITLLATDVLEQILPIAHLDTTWSTALDEITRVQIIGAIEDELSRRNRRRRRLSSNHYSTDGQLADVILALDPEQTARFHSEFPEWPNLVWSGSWVNTEASNVDAEYTSWAIDWVEAHCDVIWEDGEPWSTNDMG